MKILLNAESFGFGPSAAIAQLFPYLNSKNHFLSFIGDGHTLDLQSSLPYNKIYNSKDPLEFSKIVDHYDLFVTALDFDRAQLAINRNIPTVIYDPLTWFWRQIPKIISNKKVLYLAQGFYGVKSKILNNPTAFNKYHIVPPLMQSHLPDSNRSHVLVNLGGLLNPFWEFNVCLQYAKNIMKIIKSSSLLAPYSVIFLGSQKIASHLKENQIMCYSRKQVLELLPKVKFALQTPGLGNIYDSASYNIPTLFLPPPGDSHGQQLDQLLKHDLVDQAIDWQEITTLGKIDYYLDQKSVMEEISRHIHKIDQTKFAQILNLKIQKLLLSHQSKTKKLIDHFGQDGAPIIASHIFKYIYSN